MMAFIINPDQWELYKQERPPAADRRGAADHRVQRRPGPNWRGRSRRGSGVRSANFDDGFRPQVRYAPQHMLVWHFGVHYCIEGDLAHMTIDIMFNAITAGNSSATSLGTQLRSGWQIG